MKICIFADASSQIVRLCEQINRQNTQNQQIASGPGPTSSGFFTSNAPPQNFQPTFQPQPLAQPQQIICMNHKNIQFAVERSQCQLGFLRSNGTLVCVPIESDLFLSVDAPIPASCYAGSSGSTASAVHGSQQCAHNP